MHGFKWNFKVYYRLRNWNWNTVLFLVPARESGSSCSLFMYWAAIAAKNKSVWIVLPNAMFPFICQNILVDGAILALNNLSCSPWIIRRLGGAVIIVPLCGSILQAETCQILRLAENPRWSPSVAIMNQNYYPILNPCTVAAVYELIHRALDV